MREQVIITSYYGYRTYFIIVHSRIICTDGIYAQL
jgi:hypothetical protein